jgi:hypothetical protein
MEHLLQLAIAHWQNFPVSTWSRKAPGQRELMGQQPGVGVDRTPVVRATHFAYQRVPGARHFSTG